MAWAKESKPTKVKVQEHRDRLRGQGLRPIHECVPYGQDRSGGGRGIRTLETVSRLHTFQACAFDHSATPPSREIRGSAGSFCARDPAGAMTFGGDC